MKKVKFNINVSIDGKKNAYSLYGTYDDLIRYEEDGVCVSIDIINGIINRENDEFIYSIKLLDKVIEIYWKEKNTTFYKDILTLNMKSDENNFYCDYVLVDEDKRIEYNINF